MLRLYSRKTAAIIRGSLSCVVLIRLRNEGDISSFLCAGVLSGAHALLMMAWLFTWLWVSLDFL